MKAIKMFLRCVIAILIGVTIGIILVNIIGQRANSTEETTTEITTEDKVATPMDMTTTEYEEVDVVTEEAQIEEIYVSDEEQPVELTEALDGMVDYEGLRELSCNQLVIVQGSGSTAAISVYEADDAGLWENVGLDCSGHVGSNGVSPDSYEGSKMTPAGFFPVREAFYINEVPETGLPSFRVTANTYWVDDPDSPHYNQWVELDEASGMVKDFNSAEHMIDYASSYEYGFVIGFNDNPVVPGKGSAIFFHISSNATLGCVATDRQHVLDILKFLNVNKNPYILIK